jgi:hypothetical protein
VGKLTFNFAESRLSFLTPESRERSFSRENHLFKLTVGTAAVAVVRVAVENEAKISEYLHDAPINSSSAPRCVGEYANETAIGASSFLAEM